MTMIAGKSGFSLLEILVAVTIMGLAYVAILQNFSMSSRTIASMERGRAEALASSMAFERTLLSLDQPDKKDDDRGQIVAEGALYSLTQVADETGEFMTLKLQKK